jgi:hypothetical protein
MPFSLNVGFSPCAKLSCWHVDPDEETTDWRAVCGRTARTVRRAGRGDPSPTPIRLRNYWLSSQSNHYRCVFDITKENDSLISAGRWRNQEIWHSVARVLQRQLMEKGLRKQWSAVPSSTSLLPTSSYPPVIRVIFVLGERFCI